VAAIQLKRVARTDRVLRVAQRLKFIRLGCSVDKLSTNKQASVIVACSDKPQLTAVFAEELAPVTLDKAMRTESYLSTIVHSQNSATFVPVVRWEDVGVELGTGGGHVEGLTKRELAPTTTVINEIARRDWMTQARCRSRASRLCD
jgi:hypothetical protein